MKILKRMVAVAVKVWHLPFVKYSLIAIIGIVLVGFVGENSMLAHMRNKMYISQLTSEIEKYEQQNENDIRQIRELNHNPKAMERIARERYFMKHDDEDIFVLSDDDRGPSTPVSSYEATE